jgi:hypothetical protein
VRERGVQARRARPADHEPSPRPPSPANPVRFWQALAVVALIAAVAGWTTVAVMALRPAPAGEALASATDAPFPSADASLEPPIESHQVAELEALLPSELNGTSLTRESWTGDTLLADDPWGSAMTAFLTGAGKAKADLQVSQAYDTAGNLDLSAGAFRVPGIDPGTLRDAMIAAWKKGDYPDLKIAQAAVGGFEVTTGDFGDGAVSGYWYVRDGVVFDIETGDPTIAQAALGALPKAGTSPAP